MCSLFLTSSTDGISRGYLILRRRYIAPRTSKFCQKCFSSLGGANGVDAILHVLCASLSNTIMSCQRLLHISIYIEHDVEAKFPAEVWIGARRQTERPPPVVQLCLFDGVDIGGSRITLTGGISH